MLLDSDHTEHHVEASVTAALNHGVLFRLSCMYFQGCCVAPEPSAVRTATAPAPWSLLPARLEFQGHAIVFVTFVPSEAFLLSNVVALSFLTALQLEARAYCPLVTKGSYCIVQDTKLSRFAHIGGPTPGIARFLAENR